MHATCTKTDIDEIPQRGTVCNFISFYVKLFCLLNMGFNSNIIHNHPEHHWLLFDYNCVYRYIMMHIMIYYRPTYRPGPSGAPGPSFGYNPDDSISLSNMLKSIFIVIYRYNKDL